MTVYSVRPEMIPLAKKIVKRLVKEQEVDEKKLKRIRNAITKENGGVLPKNLELVQAYRQLLEEGKIKSAPHVMRVIQKRKIRTLSGIANITVLTKDLGCPGLCIYCPTEKGMPKSYLSDEPAMLRAVRNEFNAYKQVKTRLNGLVAQGHDVTKIDIRTAGGTWGAVPDWYRVPFLNGIYLALNEGPGKIRDLSHEDLKKYDLQKLIKENETAHCRCVGLWVETRPDWIDEEELIKLRDYGVTGIEIGVQTTDDEVSKLNKRGHGLKESIEGTRLARKVGLKICHHLMPNQPGATWESDLKSGIDLFANEGLQPDYLKIYPTMVMPYSDLEQIVKDNPDFHKAYTDEELVNLIVKIKKEVPEYCRIIRVIRDFSAKSIIIGSKTSNLRQVIHEAMEKCRCVRCREIKDQNFDPEKVKLVDRIYTANEGEEHFISLEEPTLDKLIGLCRLRFNPVDEEVIFEELKGAAIVRELHVYGRQKSLTKKGLKSNTQHMGYGRQLMAEAERLTKEKGLNKVAVIAAIGTRQYYEKLGYYLQGTYMVKDL